MKINFSNHFQTLVDRYGDRQALVHTERNRRYTFKEFHLLSNRIVNMMRDELKLGQGDCFVNILDNDNLSILHFPTIFKGPVTGAFTNYRDSVNEHLWQIDICNAKLAFIENDLLASHYKELRDRNITIVCMDPLSEEMEGVHYFWDLLESASDANPNIELDDREHCAVIRFTGGTTGTGKAAMLCIDNWMAVRDTSFAMEDKLVWNPESRMLHIAPISHAGGMFYVSSFYSGGCTVTQNQPDLLQYARNIEKEKITTGFLVPTMLYRLLDIPDVDFSSLNYILYGAAPISPAKLLKLQETFGNIFIQAYGSTEHFGYATTLSTEQHLITSAADEKRLSSAGRVVSGVECIIVDDNGQRVAQGELGELWLRSRCVCMGYKNDPEKTANEFIDGYWKSGDLGHIDEDGFIYIVDRKKDIIISGGFNIYATEVEAVINSHPAVMMSAVVGIPHEEWGEALHAEIILLEGSKFDAKELKAFVKESLGSYKSPKSVTVVDQLPTSTVGKVLRRKVREKYWKAAGRMVS